jgi:hypothetical protein
VKRGCRESIATAFSSCVRALITSKAPEIAHVVNQHTLLGVELKIGRRRLLCPILRRRGTCLCSPARLRGCSSTVRHHKNLAFSGRIGVIVV